MDKRIGIIGENSIHYISALFNVWNNDDCAVLIDWRIPAKSAIKMLEEANVLNCYLDERLIPSFALLNKSITFIPMICKQQVEVLPYKVRQCYFKKLSKRDAVVLYSSGTTGKSKGIVLSHYAITTNAEAVSRYMNVNRENTILIVKPLSHSSTLVGELLAGLLGDFEIIISKSVVPLSFTFLNINRFAVTTLCINPTLLKLYLSAIENHPFHFPSLTTVYTSGAIAGETLLNRGRDVLNSNVLNAYGLTEAGPRVSVQQQNDPIKSVGMPIENVDVIILDEHNTPVISNKKGYIHVRTPSLFTKYINSQNDFSLYDNNWLNTGDIGFIDESRNIYVSGRADNMIITGAYNIFPEEVEKNILSIPEIMDCIVYGISHPMKGVVLACDYTTCSSKIDEKHIRKYLSEILPQYEIPTVFRLCDTLSKTTTGKTIRLHDIPTK